MMAVRGVDLLRVDHQTSKPGLGLKTYLLTLTIFSLVLVALCLPSILNSTIESSDQAANSLLVQDAKHFHLLTGNYSRVGFFHPGPAILYVLAAGEWLFFDRLHLVAYPIGGQVIASAVYAAFWLASTWWVVARFTAKLPASLFMSIYVFIIAMHEPSIFISLWFPFLYALPFGCLVVSLAGALAGSPIMWLFAAVSCGFLINGHASFIGITAILVITSSVVSFATAYYRKKHGYFLSRFSVRMYFFSFLILVIFLIPLLIREFVLKQPIIETYYYFAHYGQYHGFIESVVYLGHRMFSSPLEFFIIIIAIIYCIFTPLTSIARLIAICFCCCTIATFYYVWRGVDNLDETYLIIFYSTAPAALIAVAVCEIFLRIKKGSVLTGAAMCLVLSSISAFNINRTAEGTYYSTPEIVAIDKSLREHVQGKIALVISDEHDIAEVWPLMVGEELYQLRSKKGVDFCISVNWWILYRQEERCEGSGLPQYVVDVAAMHLHDKESGMFTAGSLVFIPVRNPILSPGERIVIGDNYSKASLIFGEGWLLSRGNLVWSTSVASKLTVDVTPSVTALDLALTAFLPKAKDHRDLDVLVDGEKVDHETFDAASASRDIHIPLPADHKSQIDILLRILNPQSPAEAGISPDLRKLGVGLTRVSAE